jgi:hypothetical protein
MPVASPGGVTGIEHGGGPDLAEALAVDEVSAEPPEHRDRGRRPAKSRAPRLIPHVAQQRADRRTRRRPRRKPGS